MKHTEPKPTKTSKLGPGEYLPDPTQEIERVEDLPQPILVDESRRYDKSPCPSCGQAARWNTVKQRRLHDLGDLSTDRPRDLVVTYTVHYCAACRKYFSSDLTDLAPPYAHYTHRVMALAVRAVVEDGMPYRDVSWRLWRDHRVFVPFATIQNWVEAGGKKGDRPVRDRLRRLGLA